MEMQHRDFDWIETQLTLARWYLDAAANAAAEAAYHHLQQARNVYEVTVRSLSQLNLDGQQRGRVERELALLRVRLGATSVAAETLAGSSREEILPGR